jgi:hypothetical protein
MKRHETDKLDRMLSERLKKALGSDGPADWLDVRRRAGEAKTALYWSRRRVLLVAGVLVLAVGACAGSTGVIPWLNKEPKSVPFRPQILPICSPKNVQAKLYLQRQKASGNLTGSIVLANTGHTRCAVAGQAKVSLVGSAARATHWRVELPKDPSEPGPLFSPGRIQPQTELGMTPAVRRGGHSSVYLWWENWCGPGSGTDGFAGKPALKFEIPNGSKLVLPVYRLPGCSNSRKPSLLRVFGATPALPPMHWKTNLPLRAAIVGAQTTKRFRLQRGETFHYRVALTNTGTSPVRFGDCPSYGEDVSVPVKGDPKMMLPIIVNGYLLNCRPVKAIAPGKTVTFAIELPVPKNLGSVDAPKTSKFFPLDRGTLTWTLSTGSKRPPTATAPVRVDR